MDCFALPSRHMIVDMGSTGFFVGIAPPGPSLCARLGLMEDHLGRHAARCLMAAPDMDDSHSLICDGLYLHATMQLSCMCIQYSRRDTQASCKTSNAYASKKKKIMQLHPDYYAGSGAAASDSWCHRHPHHASWYVLEILIDDRDKQQTTHQGRLNVGHAHCTPTFSVSQHPRHCALHSVCCQSWKNSMPTVYARQQHHRHLHSHAQGAEQRCQHANPA